MPKKEKSWRQLGEKWDYDDGYNDDDDNDNTDDDNINYYGHNDANAAVVNDGGPNIWYYLILQHLVE